MKKEIYLLLLFFALFSTLFAEKSTAQSLDVNWSYTYGGSSFDHAMSGIKTSDGNYVTIGITESTDQDISNALGGEDIWVIKTDSEGTLLWEKSYGGSDYDRAFDIIQTDDNGFIFVGSTWSDDGDFSNNKGGSDLLAVKIDSDGVVEWSKTYGGSGDDGAASIIQTQDGNFVISGTTSSGDGDVSEAKGGLDIWVIKIDPSGTLIWENTYGGSDQDWTKSIRETADNGFIIGGTTRSVNGDVSSPILWDDVWVIKTDKDGTIEWEKTFGGTDFEVANDAQQTDDGGYIIAGYTWSSDGDVAELYGVKDVWILKLDAQGNLEWEKTYGGTGEEGAYAIEVVDGGYVFQANTSSSDKDVSHHIGSDDVWLVKIDHEGKIVWEQTFGGSSKDWAESLIVDGDSYLIAGYTASNDEDIPENKGQTDFWIVNIQESLIEEEPCTWTVVVQDPDYFGDEVEWELRKPDGEVLLSGGDYGSGYYDEQTIAAEGPVEFYISAKGSTNDNKPAYSISNGNGVILWGVTTGGTEDIFSGLKCSDEEWIEDYSCGEQSMETDEIVGAFEIGGSDLHNRLAIDIPVNANGLTLYGINVNFFVDNADEATFNFILYDDDNGKPGNEISEFSAQIIDSEILGSGFSRYLYQFQLKFDEALELEPEQRYWLELVTPEGAWQSIDYTPIGKGVAYNNDYTNGWVVDLTSEFIYSLVCDEDLGIEEIDQFDFSYYPNPVENLLNIQSHFPIQSLSIFDLNGRQLRKSVYNLKSIKVDLNNLPSGLYMVKAVMENDQVKTFKIIKE